MALLILQRLVFYGEKKSDSNSKICNNSIIIAISSVIFDIYIIHSHPLVYDYLFYDHFIWILDYGWIFVVPLVFICVVAIFTVSCICGFMRKKLFSTLKINRLITVISDKFDQKLGEIY